MFSAHMAVTHVLRFFHGPFQDFLGARGQPDLAHDHRLATTDDELDGRADTWELDSHVAQHLCGNAFAFTHEAKKQVFGPNVVVVEPLGLFLGEREDSASSIGKFVELLRHPAPPILMTTCPHLAWLSSSNWCC